jgi:hypothetical protein
MKPSKELEEQIDSEKDMEIGAGIWPSQTPSISEIKELVDSLRKKGKTQPHIDFDRITTCYCQVCNHNREVDIAAKKLDDALDELKVDLQMRSSIRQRLEMKISDLKKRLEKS